MEEPCLGLVCGERVELLKPLTSGWDLTRVPGLGPTRPGLEHSQNPVWDSNPRGWDSNPVKTLLGTWPNNLLIRIIHMFFVSLHRRNSVRNKVIGKKWFYSERNIVHRVWAIAEGEWAPNCGMVNFYGLGKWVDGEGNGIPLQCYCLENPRDGGAWWVAVYGVAQSRTRLKRLSKQMSGRIIPTFFGESMEISRNWATAHFLALLIGLGTVLAIADVLQWAYTEDQGLAEVDLSAILDPFDSNQLMLCPPAVSFFQRLCPAPFSPVSLPCSFGHLGHLSPWISM